MCFLFVFFVFGKDPLKKVFLEARNFHADRAPRHILKVPGHGLLWQGAPVTFLSEGEEKEAGGAGSLGILSFFLEFFLDFFLCVCFFPT